MNKQQQLLSFKNTAKTAPAQTKQAGLVGKAMPRSNQAGSAITFQPGADKLTQLLVLTCQCTIERNCVQVVAFQSERTKHLTVSRKTTTTQEGALKHQLHFKILLNYSKKEVIQFDQSQIVNVFAQNLSAKGFLSFVVKEAQSGKNADMGRARVPVQKNVAVQGTKIMLSAMPAESSKQFYQILQEAFSAKPTEQPVDSKKRALPTGGIQQNDARKVRKLTNEVKNENGMQVDQIAVKKKPKLSFSHLPWDTVNMIFDYTPHGMLKSFRVNKRFTLFVNRRRKSLNFNNRDIPSRNLFALLQECAPTIQNVRFSTKLMSIKKTEFEKFPFRPKKLLSLDLTKLDIIGETALARMIDAAKETLQTFKVSYKCHGLSRLPLVRLSNCRQLTHAEFGQANDYNAKSNYDLLPSINHFLRLRAQLITKDASKPEKQRLKPLEVLKLYECDYNTLTLLTDKTSVLSQKHIDSLEELQITKFNYGSSDPNLPFSELKLLAKLRRLQRLNLCSTFFPMELDEQVPEQESLLDVENMNGCAEMEALFFTLKNTLKRLNIGNFVWDDLIIYIAEMCKELEVLELNSQKLSDAAVNHVLKRATQLKVLDVSGITEFTGQAFTELNQETFRSKELQLVVLNMKYGTHEFNVVKNSITLLAPECQFKLDDKKAKNYFDIIPK